MANKRLTGTRQVDRIVSLIQGDDGRGKNTQEIVSLIAKANVNKKVDGVPLVSFYLNSCRLLKFGVLEAFVNNGCDLNVQDGEGRTPLHWLAGHRLDAIVTDQKLAIERVVSLVQLFLSNGADPCLVDKDGNTVLMVAVLHQQYHLFNPLTEEIKLTKKLLGITNEKGFDLLSLCFKARINISDIIPHNYVNLAVHLMSTDNRGNSVLHNLFLNPAEKYQPTVKYKKSSTDIAKNGSKRVKLDDNFESNLKFLVDSGVNVSQKNNDGLVPLLLALLSYRNLRHVKLDHLESLIPSPAVLSELVPWPQSIICTILSKFTLVKLPFLEDLVERGLNCSHEQVLSTAVAMKNVTDHELRELLSCLLKGGAKPYINDIKLAIPPGSTTLSTWTDSFKSRNITTVCLFLDHLPNELIGRLNDEVPSLVKLLISYNCRHGDQLDAAWDKLLEKGFTPKADDIRTAASEVWNYNLHSYITPQLVMELNLGPNIFEQILALFQVRHSHFGPYSTEFIYFVLSPDEDGQEW